MGHVSAASTILINAEPAAVLSAVGDYQNVRPKILSSHYHDYQVLEGGQGQGDRRRLEAPGHQVAGSATSAPTSTSPATPSSRRTPTPTMVTNWTVAPAGPGSSVTVTTTWKGAGGVKGFFEKTTSPPLGLKKIQSEVLGNLKKELES